MATSIAGAAQPPDEVSFGDAEEALSRLWVDKSEGRQRVCTLNLIIAGPGAGPSLQDIDGLAPVLTMHPARIMVLRSRGETGRPGVLVTMRCRAARSGAGDDAQQVCWEEISILQREASPPEILSGIELLRVSELPVFLWWLGSPTEDKESLFSLAGIADYVMIDTSRSDSAFQAMDATREFVSRELPLPEDLAWERSKQWRSRLAQLFEPMRLRGCLSSVRRLRIRHGASALSQAALLVGWLGTHLNWSVGDEYEPVDVNMTGKILRFSALDSSGNEIHIELREHHSQGIAPEELVSMELSCGEAGSENQIDKEFGIVRSSSGECAVVKVEYPASHDEHRIVQFESVSLDDLLSHDLIRRSSDPVYEAAESWSRKVLGGQK